MSHHQDDRFVFPYEMVPLPGTDDMLAAAIGSDGQTSYWLMRALCPDCENTTTQGSVTGADHERLGPLPAPWRARMGQVTRPRRLLPRCGRPRLNGQPCRTPVARPGDGCVWHSASRVGR